MSFGSGVGKRFLTPSGIGRLRGRSAVRLLLPWDDMLGCCVEDIVGLERGESRRRVGGERGEVGLGTVIVGGGGEGT